MKPEPKFVPAERVILESRSMPEHNGEYTVSRCRFAPTVDLVTGERSERYSYGLDGLYIGKGSDGDDILWSEKALRKLPPNTPTTFDESIWMPKEIKV